MEAMLSSLEEEEDTNATWEIDWLKLPHCLEVH